MCFRSQATVEIAALQPCIIGNSGSTEYEVKSHLENSTKLQGWDQSSTAAANRSFVVYSYNVQKKKNPGPKHCFWFPFHEM